MTLNSSFIWNNCCRMHYWRFGSSLFFVTSAKIGTTADVSHFRDAHSRARSSKSSYSGQRWRPWRMLSCCAILLIVMDCVSWILDSKYSIYYAAGAEVGFWTCLWHPKHANGSYCDAINDGSEHVTKCDRRELKYRQPSTTCAFAIIGSFAFACVGLGRRQVGVGLCSNDLWFGATLYEYYLYLQHPGPSKMTRVLPLQLCSSAPCLCLLSDYCPCLLCWSCSPDSMEAWCLGTALRAEHEFHSKNSGYPFCSSFSVIAWSAICLT